MGDQDAKMRKEIKNDLAKHGLKKTWDLRQIWSHFGRPKTWRIRGEEEKREEEEEEEKKKRGEDEKPRSKVWNFV